MSEEAGEDCGRFAFGNAGGEDGNQPVLLDQSVDGVRHLPTIARLGGGWNPALCPGFQARAAAL